MRKLPVYLLLDTSGSMYGEPIEAVKNGVQMLVSTLRQDPYALETVFLEIITFDSHAKALSPLTELSQFQPPNLEAKGQTALGEALSLLAKQVESEVDKTTPEKKGDWRPLVFIMSDGAPTDDIEAGLRAMRESKFGMVVACAAGEHADTEMLKRITDSVVRLDNLENESIKAFFKWVSASVSAGSVKVDSGKELNQIDELPPPPEEVIII